MEERDEVMVELEGMDEEDELIQEGYEIGGDEDIDDDFNDADDGDDGKYLILQLFLMITLL
jgi:hypothetical protein